MPNSRILGFCNAPGGAGKTYSIVKMAKKLIGESKNVVIIQPTKDLLRQTEKELKGTPCIVIHGDTTRGGSTVSAITKHFKSPCPEPHVVLITWAAFEQLPHFNRRQDWVVLIDEVPQVIAYEPLPAALTHQFITDHVETHTRGAVFSQLVVSSEGKLRKLAESAGKDHAAKGLSQMVRRLLSGHWEAYVEEAHYHALLIGEKHELTHFFCDEAIDIQ